MLTAKTNPTTKTKAVENRLLTFAAAIREAHDLLLDDPNAYLFGLGVTDPKGIFGTTLDLHKKHGRNRVFDTPISENALTGLALGLAIRGKRPILTHQRMEFALLGFEQLVNQAAKWAFMFPGQSAPLVVRQIIGRGWGNGPQHTQALHHLYAGIPGLTVVAPATPEDAKGLLIAAADLGSPVVYVEHRWLHGVTGHVPEGRYATPIGSAKVVRDGRDVTIVAVSYMVLEALRAAERLGAESGIRAEVIDLRSVRPWDAASILESVWRTGNLLIADLGPREFGIGAEIAATVLEYCPDTRVRRLGVNGPIPSAPLQARHCYPRAVQIMNAVERMFGLTETVEPLGPTDYCDQPDPTFTGPF